MATSGRKSARGPLPRGRSCLPCRQHKVQCDRTLPCKECVRRGREDACRKNPSPAALGVSDRAKRLLPRAAVRERLATANAAPAATAGNPSTTSLPDTVPQDSSVSARQPVRFDESFPINRATQTAAELQRQCQIQNFCAQYEAISPPSGAPTQDESVPIHRVGLSEPRSVIQHPLGVDEVKIQLANTLPPQGQCDGLLSYYVDHLDYLYRPIHVPLFRREYVQFWEQPLAEVDLSWFALLLAILSVSALRQSLELSRGSRTENIQLREMGHTLFRAKELALQASEQHAGPQIAHLQAFLVSQIYWLSTQGVEAMNAVLGKAVRQAQALGLHRPCYSANLLEREMQHRIWWEMCHSDTWQSMCLARPPLIQSHVSRVPFPLHCNNLDIAETSVHTRPPEEPSDLSLCIAKYKLFQVFNKFYKDDGNHVQSIEFVEEIDRELTRVEGELPWFYRLQQIRKFELFPSPLEQVHWSHILLHSCVRMQRLRMYRPFLPEKEGALIAWERCMEAVESILDVYRVFRSQNVERFRKSPQFRNVGYQSICIGIFLSLFLLIEGDSSSKKIRNDLEMLLSDLRFFTEHSLTLPFEEAGCRVILHIVGLYDSRSNHSPLNSASLARSVYSVFGGEASARSYLDRANKADVVPSADGAVSWEGANATPYHRLSQAPSANSDPLVTCDADSSAMHSYGDSSESSGLGFLEAFGNLQWERWDTFFSEAFIGNL